MGNLLKYSGIVTKVRAMQTHLLTKENYTEIASLHSVLEVVNYLKNQPAYAELFANLDETTLHRGDVEKLLTRSLYQDYQKLYRFADMHHREFLKLYIKRYEVNLINYCLRIVFNHYSEPFDLTYKKPFFDKYSCLDIDRLITSKSTFELVENLKGTEYYTPLKKLHDSNADSLFDYDLALNLYYFTTLWKQKKKVLKGKELELFTRDCGSKIDLLNLQWIYRAKLYYNMPPADIYSLLIPVYYHLKLKQIKEVVETAGAEEFQNACRGMYYYKRYNFEQKASMEQIYRSCLYKLYTTDRRREPYSIATVNTYLFLKEEEMNKLTTALECIRYGLAPREMLGYIGGVTI